MAFIFKMSRLCIEPFIPDVIHGEVRAQTRFVLSGAYLLAVAKNVCFHTCHISFGLENAYTFSQDWDEMSFRKLFRSNFRKFLYVIALFPLDIPFRASFL